MRICQLHLYRLMQIHYSNHVTKLNHSITLRVIPRLGPLKFYVMNSSDFLYKVRLCLINVVEKDFTPIS